MDRKIEERIRLLGEVIKRKQKAERFTNREIQRLTGIPDQTIINIKSGNNFMFTKFVAICDTIGLDIQVVDRASGETFKI